MAESMIEVRNLSKRYRVGTRLRYRTLRESIVETLNAPIRKLRGRQSPGTEDFWALNDVSFDVAPGECIGIIGRNGAGKSTLLKILSRITEPTSGHVELGGRVGSLLEVGTGFHNELSGRDNIYLNGSILGMRRSEIKKKFDEIVAFAEVDRFIDTPVKRYSSGMYMRLAFAVAAHLEPDILIVDEVLAVGDAAFQKKCLGKMSDVASHGRTVLFVSHNMTAVQSLCQQVVWLDKGTVADRGATNEILQRYLLAGASKLSVPLRDRTDRSGDGTVRIVSIDVGPLDGGTVINSGSRLRFTIEYESDRPLTSAGFEITLHDMNGAALYALSSDFTGGLPELPPCGTITCVTEPLNMTGGLCYADVLVFKGPETSDHIDYAIEFQVESGDFYGTGRMPERSWAPCLLGQQWTLGEPSMAAARSGVETSQWK